MEIKRIKHQRHEFIMTVGKHEARVICTNKREGKQKAAQAMLKKFHPNVRLRLSSRYVYFSTTRLARSFNCTGITRSKSIRRRFGARRASSNFRVRIREYLLAVHTGWAKLFSSTDYSFLNFREILSSIEISLSFEKLLSSCAAFYIRILYPHLLIYMFITAFKIRLTNPVFSRSKAGRWKCC